MLFQTSTPKKRIPLPRSSTPNKFYNLIQKKINENSEQLRIKNEQCCQHYQIPMIKLDQLLYRPKTECYRQDNLQQIWDI